MRKIKTDLATSILDEELQKKVDAVKSFKAESQENHAVIKIDVSMLSEYEFNSRRFYDESRVESLAKDIEKNGLQMPLIVNKNYKIIDGGYRFKAIQLLKIETVEARVVDVEDVEAYSLSRSLNTERNKNSVFDDAFSLLKLSDKQSEIAKKMGFTESYISKLAKISTLSERCATVLAHADISLNLAYEYALLKDIVDEEVLYDLAVRISAGEATLKHIHMLRSKATKRERIEYTKLKTRFGVVKYSDTSLTVDLKNVSDTARLAKEIEEIIERYK